MSERFHMLVKIHARKKQDKHFAEIESVEDYTTYKNEDSDTVQEKDLRRLMYERIAQGNALIEIEVIASNKWRTR